MVAGWGMRLAHDVMTLHQKGEFRVLMEQIE
jgi:hypothetical protein